MFKYFAQKTHDVNKAMNGKDSESNSDVKEDMTDAGFKQKLTRFEESLNDLNNILREKQI